MRLEIHWDTGHAKAAIDGGVEAGMAAWGEAIEAGSSERIPKLTDEMEQTSNVDVDGRQAAISYSHPGAVVQHERLNYRHPHGGQAKFLERALVEDGRDQVVELARLLRSEIGN